VTARFISGVFMNSARTIFASALTFLLLLSTAPAVAEPSSSANEKSTQAFYETIRSNPLTLRGFISGMPKGADLRVRLQESIFPEDYLLLAEKENYCITLPSYFAVPPLNGACPPGTKSAKKFFTTEENYRKAIKELSAGPNESRKRIISATSVTPDQFGFLLGSVLRNAAYQKLDYLELLIPWFPENLSKAAKKVTWQGSPADMFPKLSEISGMQSVDEGKERLTGFMEGTQQFLGEDKAKSVMVRMVADVDRTQDPSVVFAQLIYAFKTVASDPRFVGVALSGNEDHPVALRDYQLHMNMLNTLVSMERFASVKPIITAGYLKFGMIQPTRFKDRIRMAVLKGKAARISHGSAIMYENNPFALLKLLAGRNIPIEIGITSEKNALSISKRDNPFPILTKYNVPVVLVTENSGLTRIDITNEYVRAAYDYNLSYPELKKLVRNSLEYSLLPGKSLWKSSSPYTMGKECSDSLTTKKTGLCQKLLNESPKARKQWNLETAFVEFERNFSDR
jgi:adenosine deaminase/adenosine deaminase CECR1